MDQQSSPFTFVVSEQAKEKMAWLISAAYEKATKDNALGTIDWGKGHKPLIVDFSKKTNANIIVDRNMLISFINPKAEGQTLNLRLIHDNTNSVYSLVWGGGADAFDTTFSDFTSPMTWGDTGKLHAFGGQQAVQIVHLSYTKKAGYFAEHNCFQVAPFGVSPMKTIKDQMAQKEKMKAAMMQAEYELAKKQVQHAMHDFNANLQKLEAMATQEAKGILKHSDAVHTHTPAPVDESMAAVDGQIKKVYSDAVEHWKADHSTPEFMKKAYATYVKDSMKAGAPVSMPYDLWQEMYLKKLASLDKQQVLLYIYGKDLKVQPPQVTNVVVQGAVQPLPKKKVKVTDITAEELQAKLVASVKQVQDQKAQAAKIEAKIVDYNNEYKDIDPLEVHADLKPMPSKKAYQAKDAQAKQAIEGAIADKDAQAKANQELVGQTEPEPIPEPVLEAAAETTLSEEAKLALKELFKVDVQLVGGGGVYRIYFHTRIPKHVDPEKLPVVSLSRHFGSCWFRIDKLHEHDHHSSSFKSSDVKPYVLRVLHDIRDKMVAEGLATAEEVQDLDAIEFGNV